MLLPELLIPVRKLLAEDAKDRLPRLASVDPGVGEAPAWPTLTTMTVAAVRPDGPGSIGVLTGPLAQRSDHIAELATSEARQAKAGIKAERAATVLRAIGVAGTIGPETPAGLRLAQANWVTRRRVQQEPQFVVHRVHDAAPLRHREEHTRPRGRARAQPSAVTFTPPPARAQPRRPTQDEAGRLLYNDGDLGAGASPVSTIATP